MAEEEKTVKKAAAKKSVAKKSAAKKAAAKKATAKKSAVKKSATKKASVKQAASTAKSPAERVVAAQKPDSASTDTGIKRLKVTLTRSKYGRLKSHQACVAGLGLRRMHQTVQVIDTPENRGMINKIHYLLNVEEA